MRKHLFCDRRHPVAIFVLGMLYALSAIQPVAGDGWHNPVLMVGSIDDWLRDAKAAVPDLNEQLGSSSLRSGRGIDDLKKLAENRRDKQQTNGSNTTPNEPLRGGNLLANLSPEQQSLLARKADECLQVLAFMKEGNIIPREFPQFPINKMSEYRQTAKQLLGLMGNPGKEAVLGRLTGHLMAGFRSASDVAFHPNYVDELLQVLGDSASRGMLTPQELDELERAMQGAKPAEVQRLVNAIDKTLAETLAIQTLVDWAGTTKDQKRKSQILTRLRSRLSNAGPDELQHALDSGELDAKTKTAIVRELKRFLPDSGIASLLNLMLVEHVDLQQAVESELRSRKPTYEDMKGEILEIWSFADSPNARPGAYARYFVAKAFQEAPIAHCLYWLGQGNDRLGDLIWKQLDARIAGADEAQRAGFATTVFKAWDAKDLTIKNRQDCLELLGRVKHRGSTKRLVELLLTMPRELLPLAGQSLKSITGQDYGPHPGDGVAEVTVAVKQWREWAERNP